MNDPIVTMFKSVFDTENPHFVPLSVALDRIKTGKNAATIEQVRAGEKRRKNDLPVVLFSGKFNRRADVDLVEHNGLIICDFDHVDVEKTKQSLSNDEVVLACWVSPSGDGVKALVNIENPVKHKEHFSAMVEHFRDAHQLELDPSGRNISRACYESYDPDILIKPVSEKFSSLKTDERVELPEPKQIQDGVQVDYTKLQVAANMIRNARDGEKHNTLIRAARLMGGYIGSGMLDEPQVIQVLESEIKKRNIDSLDLAMKTIMDGINQGKLLPITEIDAEYYEERRKVELADTENLSYLSDEDEDLSEIMKIKRGEVELGLKTGHDDIDKYFRYKRGSFVIVNGHSSVGKTTLVLHIMINASIRHGWKWFVYSSESKTSTIKTRMIEYASQMLLQDMNEHQIIHYYKWVNEHFSFLSNKRNYSYVDVLLYAEKEMARRPFDALFVDPYNSLVMEKNGSSGFNAHHYNYEAASAMLTFCQSTGVSLWLNTHANTAAQRKKGDDGHSVAPYAEDSEGGSLFLNRCDIFLTFHRKIQHENESVRRTMEMHVRKIREQESGGRPTASDNPIRFEMNSDSTAFFVNGGKRFFNSVNDTKTAEQKQTSFSVEPSAFEEIKELEDIF
jgi:archaellum biogenesis ATPase FlaH